MTKKRVVAGFIAALGVMFLLSSVAAGQSQDADEPFSDYPKQLRCVAWPTYGWPTGEMTVGVDPAEVDRAVQRALSGDTRSVVVVHGGRIVAEGYDKDSSASEVQPSYSISKSFTSTMIGLLVDKGMLELDAPAPVPEWSRPGDRRGQITLRHLLDMASGLQWDESYDFGADSDLIRMLLADEPANFAARKRLIHKPGTVFNYSTGTTQILARIVSDTLGLKGPEMGAELDRRLFDRLGIAANLGYNLNDVWAGGTQTNMTTREFAKLGLLYLRGGQWEDAPFLDRDWVDYARSSENNRFGYAAQFWSGQTGVPGAFSARGLYGQIVYIDPSSDLVIAVNSLTGGSGGEYSELAELFRNKRPRSCPNTDKYDVRINKPPYRYRQVVPGAQPRIKFSVQGASKQAVQKATVTLQPVRCRSGQRFGRTIKLPAKIRHLRGTNSYTTRWRVGAGRRGCHTMTFTLDDGVPRRLNFRVKQR